MPLRPYEQDQMFLLPSSLNEWVRAVNPARVFSEIIDRIERIVTFRTERRVCTACSISEKCTRDAKLGMAITC